MQIGLEGRLIETFESVPECRVRNLAAEVIDKSVCDDARLTIDGADHVVDGRDSLYVDTLSDDGLVNFENASVSTGLWILRKTPTGKTDISWPNPGHSVVEAYWGPIFIRQALVLEEDLPVLRVLIRIEPIQGGLAKIDEPESRHWQVIVRAARKFAGQSAVNRV